MTREARVDAAADAVPARRLDSRIRNLGGRLLVGGPRSALELDETAGFIWRKIDGQRSVLGIAELVSAEYGVDVRTAAEDVAGLIGQLVECGVVTVTAAQPRRSPAGG